MYYAKVDDYYASEDAIFYRVAGKLDLETILQHRRNKSETNEEATARWDHEQHWLACWDTKTLLDGFYPNCQVAFGISSSTYYKIMRHEKPLYDVRNINVSGIRVIK